ncbi:MAG: class I SAM-dependent methyltransferase [Bacillota bacterium]
MPSSHVQQIPAIINYVCAVSPRTVLDVGVGFGKYGVLVREYMEIWHFRYASADWMLRIDGIEAYPDYINDLHRFIYNNIYVGEALAVMKNMENQSYDLILAIDILEHFDKEQGVRFVRECRRVGRNSLISTPRHFREQPAVFGNEYEIHKTSWSSLEMEALGAKRFIDDSFSLIAVF